MSWQAAHPVGNPAVPNAVWLVHWGKGSPGSHAASPTSMPSGPGPKHGYSSPAFHCQVCSTRGGPSPNTPEVERSKPLGPAARHKPPVVGMGAVEFPGSPTMPIQQLQLYASRGCQSMGHQEAGYGGRSMEVAFPPSGSSMLWNPLRAETVATGLGFTATEASSHWEWEKHIPCSSPLPGGSMIHMNPGSSMSMMLQLLEGGLAWQKHRTCFSPSWWLYAPKLHQPPF